MPDMVPMIPPAMPTLMVPALSEIVDWGQTFVGVSQYREQNATNGQGINVAVLDSGVPKEHPDLTPNVAEQVDFTGDSRPFNPHGCHVGGIIAAAADDHGVVGVAPEAKLYSVRVLDADGLCPANYSWVIDGLEWVLARRDIDIVNISLGAPIRPPDRLQSVIRQLAARGTLIVAASGNDSSNTVSWPAKYDECISVAAMDKTGKIARFSNVDPSLEVVAPGVDIYSTWINGGYGYAKESGTSMSAPFISGLLALMISYHRNGDAHQTPMTNYLEAVSHLQGFQDGKLVAGLPNHEVGVGVLNLHSALAQQASSCRQAEAAIKTTHSGLRRKLYRWAEALVRRILLGGAGG